MPPEEDILPGENKEHGTIMTTRKPSEPTAIPPGDVERESTNGLCDHCNRFDFGPPDSSSESLDIYRDIEKSSSSRPLDRNCPLCRVVMDGSSHTAHYYVHPVAIHAKSSTKIMVLLKITSVFWKTTFVHKVPVRDALICPTSLSMKSANMELARKWVRLCSQNHVEACGKKGHHAVLGLKVIDCISGRICFAAPGQPYIALSYVWGSQLIVSASQKYPQTIEDAMLVARELNIPYLWVDRYCIDQNDEQEKHTMISNMDKIYSGAELTIIAAAGSDPHHGLPGVSQPSRTGVSVNSLGCGSLLTFKTARSEIENSHWGTRAWTYQEMLLSRRRLAFTDSQMIFQCCEEEFQEALSFTTPYYSAPDVATPPDLDLRDLDLGNFDKIAASYLGWQSEMNTFPKDGVGKSFHEIYSRVREYTKRSLSHSEDILNAFDGIFGAFGHSFPEFGHHFWGVPIIGNKPELELRQLTKSFVAGLAWFNDKPAPQRPGDWPSWSWTTIMGEGVHCWGSSSYFFFMKSENTTECTFTRSIGVEEDMVKFVRMKRKLTEYNPCVNLTTWVLENSNRQENFGLLKNIGNYPPYTVDFQVATDSPARVQFWLDADIAKGHQNSGYVAVFLYTTGLKTCILITEKTSDLCLRRIGLAEVYYSKDVRDDIKRTQDLTWLPGPEPRNSFNKWERKTIRLV